MFQRTVLCESVFVLSMLITVTSFGCRTANPANHASLTNSSSATSLDTSLGEQLWPNEAESAQTISQLISEQIERTYPPSNRPARRDAHPKAHGCVKADFAVNANLPAELRHGVFQPGKHYKAWIRYSNGDSNAKRPDAKGDARGMAIKLTGVEGTKILPEEADAKTQDFIMINHPVFFMDDPAQYVSLIRAVSSTNPLVNLTAPLALGIRGSLIARAITSKTLANPLHAQYWSMVPYQLGVGASKRAIKYTARPCHHFGTESPPSNPEDNYLREAMKKTLSTRTACYEFLIQHRTLESQPIEDPTVEWKESEAPMVKVATIMIDKQIFSTPQQDTFCENLSFTPWHSLPEHRPLGGINRVRRTVYETISKVRHGLNGAPRAEPSGDEVF